jgi:hypothetical protein
MAVPLKSLGSKLSYLEVNEMLKLFESDQDLTSSGSYEGQIWLDTRSTPPVLKRYNGTSWDEIGEMTSGNLLSLILTIDGTGSGIDADKLDGQEGSFYQNASNLNAGTIPSARLSASDILAKLITVDGSASGLDADKLDALHASQFIRSDADDNITGHTEWQDGYQIRLGAGADLRLQHNGSASYIDNYTGILSIRQLHHGSNIILQAENASGTMKTLLTLDPDKNLTEGRIARSALVELWYNKGPNETASPYIQTGEVPGIGTDPWTGTGSYYAAYTTTPRVFISCSKNTSLTYIKTAYIYSITTTGFSYYGRYLQNTFNWLAIGKKT